MNKLKNIILYLAKHRNKPLSPLYIKQVNRWGSIAPGLFSCLPQAILVKLQDRSFQLHFGVQKTSKFEAHAWIEKDGKIIIGDRPFDNFKSMWVW